MALLEQATGWPQAATQRAGHGGRACSMDQRASCGSEICSASCPGAGATGATLSAMRWSTLRMAAMLRFT